MQEIELKLTLDEVNGIMQVLGNLPTASGAFPLLQKINEQVKAQTPPPAEQGQN